MKKVKIYITIIILSLAISCKFDRVSKGIIYSNKTVVDNSEKSMFEAKREIYKKLALDIAKEIERDDIEVIAGEIENRNIIDFSNTNNIIIKTKKSGNKYTTKIELKDKALYTNTLTILSSMKQEGVIGENIFRAKASITIEKDIELSPFTKSRIERNTLDKARENLYSIILKNNIGTEKATEMTNTAYIVEENYNNNYYTVVVESISD